MAEALNKRRATLWSRTHLGTSQTVAAALVVATLASLFLKVTPWIPTSTVRVYVGACPVDVHAGIDVFLVLGYVALFFCVALSGREDVTWARAAATITGALASLSAGASGSRWYEAAFSGTSSLERVTDRAQCLTLPSTTVLMGVDQGLWQRSVVLILVAAGALFSLSLREHLTGEVFASRPVVRRRTRWGVPLLALTVGLVLVLQAYGAQVGMEERSDGQAIPPLWQALLVGLLLCLLSLSWRPLVRVVGRSLLLPLVGLTFSQYAAAVGSFLQHSTATATYTEERVVQLGPDLPADQLGLIADTQYLYLSLMVSAGILALLSRWVQRRYDRATSAASEAVDAPTSR